MRRDHLLVFMLTFLAIGSLGCLNVIDGRYGKACEVDDDCGISSTRNCLGGYCSGQRCNFESSTCDRNQTCVGEQTGLISNARCFEECEDDSDCPETWHCAQGLCDYHHSSRGELVPEMTRAETGEPVLVALEILYGAGAPSEITWYARGYGEAEGVKVAGPGDAQTHAYTFEGAGLYTIEATFTDANGSNKATSEEKLRICGREGASCDDSRYAHCCDGFCMKSAEGSSGVCAAAP